MKRLVAIALVGISSVLASARGLHADQITIQFSGLDLTYNGSTLYDTRDINGGLGIPAEATPLVTATFFLNNTLVGLLTSDIFIDVILPTINIPTAGGLVNTSGSGNFDLLTKNQITGWGLANHIDNTFALIYVAATRTLFGSGSGTISSQDLPFGLVAEEPVTISFSLQLSDITASNGFLTGFRARGTGEINSLSSAAVPEPASLAMLGLGGAVIGWRARRRRSAEAVVLS